MGTFTPMRSAIGEHFMQWRATERGAKMPLFGPEHPVNPVCVICGAKYYTFGVTVEGVAGTRTDIKHDWPLHKNHPGINDEVKPADMRAPRRAYSDDDD